MMVRMKRLGQPDKVAYSSRFRLDTGANVSSVTLALAADVLDYFPNGKPPTPDQLKARLLREVSAQKLAPIQLTSASGADLTGYPLWIPIEIADDHGEVAELEALVSFTEGQDAESRLAGLTGFLDRFDVSLKAQAFSLRARPNSGVRCPRN
ncbi:MAG: hypothetical protein JNG89_01075 [Planctomycetaceae bacterium]|nr:hypothetical protein [Planctomycetaceae bacterium]